MNLNPKIKELLLKHNINVSEGMFYLFAIYHELDTTSLPVDIKAQVNLTKIVERDYQTIGNVIWHIPLYDGDTKTETAWEWIEDWRRMFGNLRQDAIGNKSACYKKMKVFFSKNPEVRKDDILSATQLYLNSVRDVKYLQQADYFISKAITGLDGRTHQSRLEQYLEVLKNSAATADPTAQRSLGQVVR